MKKWNNQTLIHETAVSKVYKVVDEKKEIRVLKVIKPDLKPSFTKITKSLKPFLKLRHDAICRIYEYEIVGDELHILMEFIDGSPLSRSTLEIDQVIKTFKTIAGAVAILHKNNLLHLDLKPENIMITDSGIKLIDFDLSEALASENSASQQFSGSVIYSSPEQCNRSAKPDRKSDIYSLGLILLEMLTGKLQYSDASFEEIVNYHINGITEQLNQNLSKLSDEVKDVVQKAISLDPTQRFLQVDDMITALEDNELETDNKDEDEIESILEDYLAMHKTGNTEEALTNLEELFPTTDDPFTVLNTIIAIREDNPDELLLKEYSRLGNLYLRTTVMKLALEPFTKAVKLAEELNIPEYILAANDDLAWFYLRVHEIKKSREISIRMIAFADQQKLVKDKIRATGMLANSYLEAGEYEDGKEILLNQIKLYDEIGDKQGLASTHSNIGLCERSTGHLKSAEEHYLKALEIGEELESNRIIAICYSSLGVTYNLMGDYDRSIEYLEKKIEMEKEANNLRGLSIGYSSLANSYNQKGSYEKALQYYKLQYDIDSKQNNIVQLIACYFNQATVYFKLHQFSMAESFLNKAIDEAEANQMPGKKLFYMTLRASIYERQGRYDEAIQLSKYLLDEAEKSDLTDVTYEATLTYARTAFNMKEDFEVRNTAIFNLMKELETTEHDSFKLEYCRCIFQLTGSELHRQRAISLLKQFNNDTPSLLWENGIRELEDSYESKQVDTELLIHSMVKLMSPETANDELLRYLTMSTDADNCRIVTFNRDEKLIENSIVSKNLDREDLDFSTGIIKEAAEKMRPILIRNAVNTDKFKTNESILGKSFLSVITVPLLLSTSIVGALYLDRRNISKGVFTDADESKAERIGSILLPILRSFLSKQTDTSELLIQEKTGFVGNSEVMRTLYKKLSTTALAEAPVLITGESGTGKEVTARAIHNLSQRVKGPFISINCAAIPEHLAESELFGYTKGAFTGAMSNRKGMFELAKGGSLFLDEIGELPLQLQAKLLRAIENNEITPLGSEKTVKTDVRIISATNRDLQQEVTTNKFRNDLYFRLNVFNLTVPALREHKEDIPLLAESFLKSFAKKYGRENNGFSQGAMEFLTKQDYKLNNVRELRNMIEKGVVNGAIDFPITVSNLIGEETNSELLKLNQETLELSGIDSLDDAISQFEVKIIEQTLKETNWNKSKTASRLKTSRPRIDRIIKRHGLKKG